MPLIQFIGILALLGTVAAVGVSVAVAVWSIASGRPRRAFTSLAIGVGIGLLYVTALVVVSLRSRREVLAVGVEKRFCGFYLDCHLSAAVERVDTSARIGNASARGRFWIVSVRLANSARRVPLQFEGLRLRVLLPDGRWFLRDVAAGQALGDSADDLVSRPFGPGGIRVVRVVFDLPRNATAPLLSAKEGVPPDTGIEGLLLGDEDSALHQPVLLALAPTSG